MIQLIRTGALLLFSLVIVNLEAQSSFQEHVELGDVHWKRNYEDALATAKKEKKPILILFQEVPGCRTCRNYGNDVLTHPHIVEAIESYFIPLCIFNNKGGNDKAILDKYNEPTWNNPVVRVITADEENIVKRLIGNYSFAGLVSTINTALIKSGNLVPEYLFLLEKELFADLDEIYLSMFCFWTGEKEISIIKGVISTEAGFMNGKEVVKVRFDKNETSAKKIKKAAAKKSCGDQLYINNTGYRRDEESKYYLQHSLLKYVPMTTSQATQVNRALATKNDPLRVLSPKQLAIYRAVKNSKGKGYENLIEKDFKESWNRIIKLN